MQIYCRELPLRLLLLLLLRLLMMTMMVLPVHRRCVSDRAGSCCYAAQLCCSGCSGCSGCPGCVAPYLYRLRMVDAIYANYIHHHHSLLFVSVVPFCGTRRRSWPKRLAAKCVRVSCSSVVAVDVVVSLCLCVCVFVRVRCQITLLASKAELACSGRLCITMCVCVCLCRLYFVHQQQGAVNSLCVCVLCVRMSGYERRTAHNGAHSAFAHGP